MNKNCPKCGKPIREGYIFCGKCGFKFPHEIIQKEEPFEKEIDEEIKKKEEIKQKTKKEKTKIKKPEKIKKETLTPKEPLIREKSKTKWVVAFIVLIIIFSIVVAGVYYNSLNTSDSTQTSGEASNGNSHTTPTSEDSDNDGYPDDVDIFDNGNAGIRVHISFYQDDGTMDKLFFAPDPYFEISINLFDKDGNMTSGGSKKSQVFEDKRTLYIPFSFTIDADEDITAVDVEIAAWDADSLIPLIDSDDPIDLSAKSSEHVSKYEFNPRLNNYKSNSDDGSLDLIDDEFDARIDYTIEIVEI